MVQQTDLILNGGKAAYVGRWGCYFCSLLAAAESITSHKFNRAQLEQLFGAALLNDYILHANYKNHTRIADNADGWGVQADPEWHCYVVDAAGLLALSVQLLSGEKKRYRVYQSNQKPQLKNELAIAEYKTFSGSHFVLVDGYGEVYNPDKTIVPTEIKSYRRIEQL